MEFERDKFFNPKVITSGQIEKSQMILIPRS